jgi:hypothetical protein
LLPWSTGDIYRAIPARFQEYDSMVRDYGLR